MTTPAGAPASGLAPGADGPVWHALSADRVLQAEKVDGQRGLSPAEVVSRARQFGPNAFDAGKVESRWRAFVRQYADPMQIVLLVAGIVSLFLKEFETGVVLILLTLFNAVLGLHQEGKAAAAVAALQQMMIVKAKVMRDGQAAVTCHGRPARSEAMKEKVLLCAGALGLAGDRSGGEGPHQLGLTAADQRTGPGRCGS